ncbi:MerR family transcriptional regulator [Achromobacter xylosoxidans]
MTNTHLLAGRFGALTQLSPKALRLYADQGLLVPDRIDPATGYRYYAISQAATARLIARLRRLGLPMARIARLLALDEMTRAPSCAPGWRRRRTGWPNRVSWWTPSSAGPPTAMPDWLAPCACATCPLPSWRTCKPMSISTAWNPSPNTPTRRCATPWPKPAWPPKAR